jgi:glycosyltransferase involved in cell wall biosynthesis
MKDSSILLVPDKFTWILGTIARNIVRYNPEFSFAYATRDDVRRQPDQVVRLVRQVNLLHWIIDLEFFPVLPEELASFPGTIASVHHVLDWNLAQKCRSAKFIHTVSTEWRDYLLERGIAEDKINVIPNGIDPSRFNTSISQLEARRLFGLPVNAFIVGFFGSAHAPSRPRKGVDVFIQAVQQLKLYIPELWLFISGQNWAADVAEMRQAGLNVFHPGFIPARRLPAAYRALNTFVVSSTVEGGPVTAFEAMASGIPLVSTSIGMVRDAVRDGQHALIIPKNQPEALVDAIQRLYTDSILVQNITTSAISLVRQNFLWEIVAPRYGDLYRNALDGRTAVVAPAADPFVHQRRKVLQHDMVALIDYTWKKRRHHEAIQLLSEDVPGLGERLVILWIWITSHVLDFVYLLYQRLSFGSIKLRIQRWLGI